MFDREFSFKLAVQANVYLTAVLIGPSITLTLSDWLLVVSLCKCGNLAAISWMIGWRRARGGFGYKTEVNCTMRIEDFDL